jgi:hypothetical protein
VAIILAGCTCFTGSRVPRKRLSITVSTARKIVSASIAEQRRIAKRKELAALYANDISLNQWDNIHRAKSLVFVKHRVKRHTGRLENYQFDKALARELLGDNLELGLRWQGRWSALAREVGPVRKNGEIVKNAGQVTEAYHLVTLHVQECVSRLSQCYLTASTYSTSSTQQTAVKNCHSAPHSVSSAGFDRLG